ncbi:hypothetical protein GGI02_005746, partial [Coemansia sp. RSA 2322]
MNLKLASLLLATLVGCVSAQDDGSDGSFDVNAIASMLSADFNDEINEISPLWTDTDFLSSLSSVLADNTDLWASVQATISAALGAAQTTDIGNPVSIIATTDPSDDTTDTDNGDSVNNDAANTDTADNGDDGNNDAANTDTDNGNNDAANTDTDNGNNDAADTDTANTDTMNMDTMDMGAGDNGNDGTDSSANTS